MLYIETRTWDKGKVGICQIHCMAQNHFRILYFQIWDQIGRIWWWPIIQVYVLFLSLDFMKKINLSLTKNLSPSLYSAQGSGEVQEQELANIARDDSHHPTVRGVEFRLKMKSHLNQKKIESWQVRYRIV